LIRGARTAREIEFFTEHDAADVEHSRRQIEVCGRHLDTPQLEARALQVAEEICQLRWASISELYRSEMLGEKEILPVRRFERLTAARPDRHGLVFLLITGYLFIWGAFGIAAHLLDAALHLIVRESVWLAANGWILGAVVLVVAGAFQFGRLRYRCLDQCRSPVGFLVRHWRGRRPSWDALHLGAHHGAFCVGCCWAIMLLMFVVGTGNVGWMLALGATMAVEKNMPWGRRLSRPLGVVLVTWGALVAAVNTG